MGLTHLNFADDLLVFTDGRIGSIDSIIEVFNYFGIISGLKISMEKTTIFYAGMQDNVHQQLEQRFSFTSRTLHLWYLGLPLLTERMGKTDYGILIEKIRSRINHWTNRFLSLAGRYINLFALFWSVLLVSGCLVSFCQEHASKK